MFRFMVLMTIGVAALAQVRSKPPRALLQTEPEYSQEARMAGIQGVVVLQCDVGKDGLARNIEVVQKLDSGLDQKAIEAVKQWHFSPATKDGHAVAWKNMKIPITFALPKEPAGTETDSTSYVIWAAVIAVLIVLILIGVKLAGSGRSVSNDVAGGSVPRAVSDIPVHTEEPQFVSALYIPISETLPPNAQWQNRFEVRSTTSNRRYVIAQHQQMRYWSCSCPGWKQYRHCKHLERLSLPPYQRPHEVHFESTGVAEQQPAKSSPPELSDSPNIDLSSAVPPRFVVFDLETTGLDPMAHDIIEIGAIRVHFGSTVHDTFQALVRPTRRIPKKITQITGISQDMVDKDGEALEAVISDFAAFIGDLPLVSYGADFDMGFLQDAAKRHNIVLSNRVSCALKMARRAWPNLRSHRLNDVAKAGNFDENVKSSTADEGAHRALGDCKRTMFVYTLAASALGLKVPSTV